MSIQDALQAAGEEYARRLEKQQEMDRLAALVAEARHHGNASIFAQAFEAALNAEHTETRENQ